MTEAPWVLLTDAEERAVLAAARGLRAAGYRVTAVAGRRPAAAHWSRSVDERVTLADPVADPERFVDGVAERLRARSYAAVLPGTEASMLALSAARTRLDGLVRLGLPPHDVVLRAFDKVALVDRSAAVGLAAPDSTVCDDEAEGLEAARAVGFPVVLKPRESFLEDGDKRWRRSAFVARDEAELLAAVPEYGRPFLIQRFEDGPIVSVAGVVVEGAVRALCVARYVRTWPASGGSVSHAVTIEPPAELVDAAEQLLRGLDWEGIFELELVERRDGGYAALDLNPRVYGSLALAVRAGANLPAVWVDHLRGVERPRVAARARVLYRCDDFELRNLLQRVRRRELTAAGEMVRPQRPTVYAYARLDDPAPLAARLILLARRARARQ